MLIKNLFKHWTYQVFSPGTVVREKYEAFKSLLEHDKRAHELMAELEEIYYDHVKVDFSVIERKYAAFSECVRQIVENLLKMRPAKYAELAAYHKKFDFYIRFMLSPTEYDFSPPFTQLLNQVTPEKASMVGGKALHLAEIGNALALPVPPGFVITTNAFYYFLKANDLRKSIDRRLSAIDVRDTAALHGISEELTGLITEAKIPGEIETAITSAIEFTMKPDDAKQRFAVRSSAVGEDGAASFAGQYKTVLNVDKHGIFDAYKEVLASKYTPEAIYYRINYGLTDMETPMAVLVLEMIDAAASGVMYTQNLDGPETDQLDIHAVWGLGELLVQGEVSPDIFRVKKVNSPKIVDRNPGVKSRQMVFDENGGTQIIPVANQRAKVLSLNDDTVITLARWGMRLENHYGKAQDVEWCVEPAGQLFLLQSRGLKSGEFSDEEIECRFEEIENNVLLSAGNRASSGVGAGSVVILQNEADLDRIPENTVLVTPHASSTIVRVMGKLAAVVTDTGSAAGHFASVAREFGVPALVDTGNATNILPPGRKVTVYADGKTVYDGMVQSLLENPCVRRDLMADSPFSRRLEYVIGFVSPLKLVNPEDPGFVPGSCRSMHDIIRFSHEKAVEEMFTIGNRRTGRKMGARKLKTDIPMLIYMLDVGEGFKKEAEKKKEIGISDLQSTPTLAVWKGLSHPDIHWSRFTHFNWEEYDRIVMSGGIISADSAQLASYAVVSREYLNLNLKFGYHFVILDTVCSDREEENHILFRFAGGGGDEDGRHLRADFLTRILERLGFWVDKKSDLVDARFENAPKEAIAEKLDWMGRLLGATRLMDMYLKEPEQTEQYAEEFLNGRYHFAAVEMEE